MATVLDLGRIRQAHRRFLAENESLIRVALWHGGKAGVQEVLKNPGFTPRTGDTQKATDYRIIRTKTRRILRLRNRSKLAHILDKGSKRHWIKPLGPWPLRFWSDQEGGHWVSTYLVDHPGTRPYRFLKRGMGRGITEVRRRLKTGAFQLARRFGR